MLRCTQGRGHTSAQSVVKLSVSSQPSLLIGLDTPIINIERWGYNKLTNCKVNIVMLLFSRKMHFREQGLSEEEAKLRLYYFCDTCGKSYANKASLRLHKLHVHEKYSEEVPCDVCGISFRTRELLKQV